MLARQRLLFTVLAIVSQNKLESIGISVIS